MSGASLSIDNFPPWGPNPAVLTLVPNHTAFRKDPGPPRATVSGDRPGATAGPDTAATTTGGKPEPREDPAK